MVRINYFAVMVMYSHAIFIISFYESQVEELKISFTKEKNNTTVLMTLLLLFYYFFYDLKYLNSTENRFSNKKQAGCLQ